MSAELVSISVPGTDRQIMAMPVDGEPMISLRHVCDSIGIALESQKRKLSTRSWATTTQQVAVAEDGKQRTMTMIDRRTLTMLALMVKDLVNGEYLRDTGEYREEAEA